MSTMYSFVQIVEAEYIVMKYSISFSMQMCKELAYTK